MKKAKYKIWVAICKTFNSLEKIIFAETHEQLENKYYDLLSELENTKNELEYLRELQTNGKIIEW